MWGRIKKIESVRKNVVIGIYGFQHGCGTTHMSLSFAVYLKRCCGCKTAYLEMNRSGQIRNLQRHSEVEMEKFLYQGITICPDASWDMVRRLKLEKYEAIIIDFGCKEMKLPVHMNECDLKLLIFDQARWKKDCLTDWIRSDAFEDDHKFLVRSLSRKNVQPFCVGSGIRLYPIPLQNDPFQLEPEMTKLLHMLI